MSTSSRVTRHGLGERSGDLDAVGASRSERTTAVLSSSLLQPQVTATGIRSVSSFRVLLGAPTALGEVSRFLLEEFSCFNSSISGAFPARSSSLKALSSFSPSSGRFFRSLDSMSVCLRHHTSRNAEWLTNSQSLRGFIPDTVGQSILLATLSFALRECFQGSVISHDSESSTRNSGLIYRVSFSI